MEKLVQEPEASGDPVQQHGRQPLHSQWTTGHPSGISFHGKYSVYILHKLLLSNMYIYTLYISSMKYFYVYT